MRDPNYQHVDGYPPADSPTDAPEWWRQLDAQAHVLGADIDDANRQVWGDSFTFPLTPGGILAPSNAAQPVNLVRLKFPRPVTLALDLEWAPKVPGGGLVTPRFGYILTIGIGRATRVVQLSDLPRIVTASELQVSAVRLDTQAFAATLKLWATPQETSRPELTVLSYAGGTTDVLTGLATIAMDAIPADATHIGLMTVDVTDSWFVRQTVGGVALLGMLRQNTPGGFPVGLHQLQPLIRQATLVEINVAALVAKQFLALFYR